MFKLKLIAVFLLLFMISPAKSMNDSAIVSIQNNIIDLKFTQASKQITSLSSEQKAEKAWLLGYMHFIQLLTTEKTKSEKLTEHFIDSQIKIIKNQQLTSASHYYLADLFLMNSFLSFNNQEYLSGFNQYRKAKSHIDKSSLYPESKKFELIDLLVELWLSENFKLFAGKNDLEYYSIHFQQITQSIQNNSQISPAIKRESRLIAGLLYPYFENNQNQMYEYTEKLFAKTPLTAPIEVFVFCKNGQKANKVDTVISVLQAAENEGSFLRFNRLNLMMGNIKLNIQHQDAENYLKTFIQRQENGEGTLYAKLKLMWFYKINNNNGAYHSVQSTVLANNLITHELDKQAAYELKDSNNWTRPLLLARTLFDGGFFQASLDTLLSIRPDIENYNKEQRLTYAYQLARCYHKLNETAKALVFYNMAISSGLDNLYYYPAYAAYYAGIIYESIHKEDLSHHYFEKCLTLDSPVYESDIHHRAISRLK